MDLFYCDYCEAHSQFIRLEIMKAARTLGDIILRLDLSVGSNPMDVRERRVLLQSVESVGKHIANLLIETTQTKETATKRNAEALRRLEEATAMDPATCPTHEFNIIYFGGYVADTTKALAIANAENDGVFNVLSKITETEKRIVNHGH